MKKLLLNSKSIAVVLLFALASFSGKTYAATYYSSAAAAAPETLANWWANTNGTGAHPANFTTAGDIFVIQTGDVMTQVAATWTVAGTVNINLGGTLVRGAGNTMTFGALVIDGTMTNANGASVTVNGNVSGTGSLQTGGTARVFNVTGDWTYSGTMGAADGVSLTMNGTGNQLLSGNFCQATATNGALIINKASGIVTLGSNITVFGSTTSAFTLTAGTFDAATFLLTATTRTFTAGTIRVGATTWAGNFSGAITQPAGGIIEYYRAGAQTVNNVTYAGKLILSGSGAKTTTGVTIGATGTLTVQGTATATATPTYTAGATLEYAGSAAQTTSNTEFPAAAGPSNLIINNTSGVTINLSRTIAGTLTLTNGNLTIATGNTLTISGTAAIGGTPGAAKYIVTAVNTSTGAQGFLSVINIPANTAYLFPIGDASNYLPATLTPSAATTTANNDFTLCAFPGVTTNGAPNGTAFNAGQKARVVDAVWTINYLGTGTPIQGAGSTAITVAWPAALEGSLFTANSNSLIGIAHWDGPSWGTCVGVGDNAANTATRTNVTTFSPFGVGTISAGGGPLPIKVNYFNAAKGNGYNTLNWSAESTSESATFDIERSADGKNFTAISSITATRFDMSQPFSYVDNSNLTGTVYYRIKITDFNGKVTYTSVVRIASAVNDMKLVAVLPNPVSNTAQLNVVSAKKDNVQLSVVSMTGQLVQRSTVQLQSGSSIINLDVANLQSGMYTIKGTFSDGTVSTVKFVKQ